MSLADVTSARNSPTPACPECDTTASVTSDLHKYQVACTCTPGSAQYACADDPGPPPVAKADTPPALPPRPPASVLAHSSTRNNASVGCNGQDTSCRRRKYAWWCVGCGALAAALGGLLAAQHILVRAYTASPHHLETVPAAVPAAMFAKTASESMKQFLSYKLLKLSKYAWWSVGCGSLAAALGGLLLAAQHILVRAYTASPHHLEKVPAAVLVLTGVCIMSLARRRNRYSYMIKVVGACCLMCALTCVLVTITTTVIHMNKLQTLKFCEYTKLTRTCTCFSMPPDSHHDNDDEGVRCVFEGVSGCGVVHGALYWCLRGVFALSVSAVLVCIFSCMLAYQLLSHERKKMYWEQLELRCRSLYRPPSGQPTPSGARAGQAACGCCQCHPQPAWDISLQHRFWAPGRIGNLYSPNPGTGRKTSAWSWFPWPRSNSQNSRCRMGGVPQSGDSAYGFCDTDANPANNAATYDERSYSHHAQLQTQGQFQNQANFTPAQGNFQGQAFQSQGNFGQNGNFGQTGNFGPGYQEGFAESSGSFDAQTGVWGPPPPYSPQGRGGSRHHLHHQDPAAATLLHHHHIDVHRTMPHEHTQHTNIQPHTCTRNSYLHHNAGNPEMLRGNSEMLRGNSEMLRGNSELLRGNSEMMRGNSEMLRNSDMRGNEMRSQELLRANPELARVNQGLLRANPEMTRMSQEIIRANPELGQMTRLNPEMARLNSEMAHLNPEMARLNPEMACLNEMGHIMEFSNEEMEMAHIQDGRFNTLRGHLVPYRCQRIGMSANNLHRDCRMDENVALECMHQKSGSKVSDQSSESCPKQGKENLGFQNDKHSPIRASMECRAVNQNAESEVYFADVSSCCNVSVKAECCMNPNVSALVGTIENHPESTSESDTGSFTLTRSQRPQPQVGSKRRPRQEKHKNQEKIRQNMLPNSSLRLTEHQIEQLNLRMSERNDLRMSERNDLRMSERNDLRMSERNDLRMSDRNDLRMERNDSRDRLERNDSRDRLNESRDRLNERNDSRDRLEGLNDSRICDRMNETRLSERLNDSRFERMNDSRISERLNDSRLDRLNDSRIERLNDSRISERLNDARISDRMNESRLSERLNESRISDRMNESRLSERLNESRISDRMNETRMSERLNDSRINRLNESDRLNESRHSDRNERVIERIDLNSSIKEGSPKMRSHISPLRMPRSSPKNLPKEHPRQNSSESCKVDFFVPPPPIISPLSPNTEESLLSDDDRPQDQVYSNEPEPKCLGPDSQYESVREEKVEVLKGNHHHCYSDTNTMDSGWQSGSEKQVTD